MLIDVHAHFYTERSGVSDWQDRNRRRIEVGDVLGIDVHVASILGSWGATSPTYFPSPDDVTHANARMMELSAKWKGKVKGYCVVNPNFGRHALEELSRGVASGMIGVKLAASRRANDALVDPIAEFAGANGLPVLHHIWQHRRRDWPGQEASDAVELAELASRHGNTRFILAHIGGGGDWSHSLRALRGVRNVWVDLSGSGVDSGMLEQVVAAVGVSRMLWGCDITLDTGLAKLRHLEAMGLSHDDLEAVRAGNARAIFPRGAFQ
jgi:uncharacterized protein